ncbi:hypothetical protein [uncultured Maricaulis sp.]|uniref:hypothetical protein n=1 Tax=uncultured Maricaulis sp. TaxID=174710 RepID=UPI0030D97483
MSEGSDGLVQAILGRIGEHVGGVSAGDLPTVSDDALRRAITLTEEEMPVLDAVLAQAGASRFDLNRTELVQGGWASAWRPGWMYLLGAMWMVRLMVVPFIDAVAGTRIAEGMDLTAMLTLTSWFLGLYMGGHTLKTLGQAAVDAVRASRETRS